MKHTMNTPLAALMVLICGLWMGPVGCDLNDGPEVLDSPNNAQDDPPAMDAGQDEDAEQDTSTPPEQDAADDAVEQDTAQMPDVPDPPDAAEDAAEDVAEPPMDVQEMDDVEEEEDAQEPDVPDPPPPGEDPFAPQPDTSQGLTNVSASLGALLENGALATACDLYRINPDDERQKLLCGKEMFFYEAFGTVGIPAPIFDFMGNRMPDFAPGFEGLGMVQDPNSFQGRPLGVADGRPLGLVPTVAFTCASCHFGQLPDGRYAVGAANHQYEYGLQNLAVLMLPTSVTPGWDPAAHHSLAIERLDPMITRLQEDDALRGELFLNLLPLIGEINNVPSIDVEIEGHYARWAPGTMDFLISPLPADDEVMTVSKIAPLWAIPTPAERQAAGMDSAMLGWTGNTPSLAHFVADFVRIGGGNTELWPADRLEPLVAYIHSLRAPEPLDAPDAELVQRGAALFAQQGCTDCHSGPRGSGLQIYDFETIGTDDRMMLWGDPDQDGQYCCELDGPDAISPTHGIKSPRLVGLWTMERWLHNGAVEDFGALLCLDGPRTDEGAEPGYSAAGHTFGCDMERADKEALIAYLLSH